MYQMLAETLSKEISRGPEGTLRFANGGPTRFDEILKPLFKPERLQLVVEKVLGKDQAGKYRDLLGQYDKADNKAMVRGKIMEAVIEETLSPYFDRIDNNALVRTPDGQGTYPDYIGRAKADVLLPGGHTIRKGQLLGIEIKTGHEKDYLQPELRGHVRALQVPGLRQEVGGDGHVFVLVNQDFKNLPLHTQRDFRDSFAEGGTRIWAGMPRLAAIDAAIQKAADRVRGS